MGLSGFNVKITNNSTNDSIIFNLNNYDADEFLCSLICNVSNISDFSFNFVEREE